MPTFSNEEIVYRTSRTLISHLRNHIEENRNGNHTRLFQHLLHPEERYVHLGTSTKVTATTPTRAEHVVPCCVMLVESRRLVEEGRLSDDAIARLLQKHWKLATITREEAHHLDYTLGYKSTMPGGWCYESDDTLVRLKKANITLVAS